MTKDKTDSRESLPLHLVSCVARKGCVSAPAKLLYESDWFQKARRYVERSGAPWRILSAKYGLLDPDSVIAPYDETLNNMPVFDRREWANQVLRDLLQLIQPRDSVVFLAGARYREFLTLPLRNESVNVEIPMEGLRIGEQLHWFDLNTP